MPASLLGKFKRKSKPRYAVPDGIRVYAVGDVHGCLDQLNRVLDAIDRDLSSRNLQSRLVFLGDLVDRGPQSAQVIDRLLNGTLPTDRCDFIMGNHEEVMLDCYSGTTEAYGAWLQYGGLETLESYGVQRQDISNATLDLAAVMRAVIAPEHIQFLRSFRDFVRIGDYLFVHAGIRPAVALDDQSARDLRWIRRGFLDDSADHGLMVVHGHTIVADVEFRENRIAIDTGCYLTGQLSAIAIEAGTAKAIVVGS